MRIVLCLIYWLRISLGKTCSLRWSFSNTTRLLQALHLLSYTSVAKEIEVAGRYGEVGVWISNEESSPVRMSLISLSISAFGIR